MFAGSFDAGAVADICEISRADAIDLVEALYARSLVASADEVAQRFRLLESLKAYAEDRLVDAGEADAVRDGHAEHFARRSATANPTDAQNIDRNLRLLPDLANLLQAADLLESQHRWDELADLLWGLGFVSTDHADSMLGRIHRCERRVSLQDRLDRLAQAELFCTMTLADWNAYGAVCAKLRRSPNESTAAYGYLYLALVTGRHAPDDARSLIDRFVDLASGATDVDVAGEAALWRAMVAAMDGDLEAARPLAAIAADSSIGQTAFGLIGAVITGIASWAKSEPTELTAIVDRIESVFGSSELADRLYANPLRFSRALALTSDDLEAARVAVRQFSVDAASGRNAQVAGDAVALLAELARCEGDIERARELIMDTGPGRTPASVGAIRHIATILGVDGELHASFCSNMSDPDWMIDRPKRTLARELERRGWAETT